MVPGEWTVIGVGVAAATYVVVAAFYVRLGLHAFRWWEATGRSPSSRPPGIGATAKVFARAVIDIVFLRRLLVVNPALWIGEWVFHWSLLLVMVRHLRYFMNPVPAWVVWAQTPGWIAGFLLPVALMYILGIRLLTRREKYSSTANLLMLLDVLAIGSTGLLMSTRYRADLAAVKLFAIGIVTFAPSPPPLSVVFVSHLGLALALLLYVPSHVFTAPLVMVDARARERELERVLHDG